MINILIHILIASLAVFVTAYILPGIAIKDFGAAIVVAIILGLLNYFIKPVLLLVSLPINIVTLGLFTFVINALLVMLVGAMVSGFGVKNFWWALAFSLILSLINGVLNAIF